MSKILSGKQLTTLTALGSSTVNAPVTVTRRISAPRKLAQHGLLNTVTWSYPKKAYKFYITPAGTNAINTKVF